MGTESIRRGDWHVSDRSDGFSITMRPRIGVLSMLSGFYLAAFCTLTVAVIAVVALDRFRGPWLLLLALLTMLLTWLAVTGSVWLLFGSTTLGVDRDGARLIYNHNWLRRETVVPVEALRAISIDHRWVLKFDPYNQLGHWPQRGPLRLDLRKSYGMYLYFGGNISMETAQSVQAAVLERIDRQERCAVEGA